MEQESHEQFYCLKSEVTNSPRKDDTSLSSPRTAKTHKAACGYMGSLSSVCPTLKFSCTTTISRCKWINLLLIYND